MAEDSTPHEAQLLAGLAAGDERAFAALYDRYGTRLYRTALGLLGSRQDAEDCLQDLFAALFRSRQRLAAVRGLAPYLFASLRRLAARRAMERRRDPPPLSQEPLAAEPCEDPRAESLRRALRSLSSEQREVIALKIEGDLTFQEMACVLQISANTAASRYRYALIHLRQRMRE